MGHIRDGILRNCADAGNNLRPFFREIKPEQFLHVGPGLFRVLVAFFVVCEQINQRRCRGIHISHWNRDDSPAPFAQRQIRQSIHDARQARHFAFLQGERIAFILRGHQEKGGILIIFTDLRVKAVHGYVA